MKNIGINKPCSENWNEMSKNEQGAFCQKCASQVHDFTNKSSLEIKQTLLSLIGQPVCGRITSNQEVELNEDFNRWMNRKNQHSFQSQLLFALLIVFGLGLFSCENPKDEKKIKEIQTSVARIVDDQINPDSTSLNIKSSAQDSVVFLAPVITGEMSFEDEYNIAPQEEIPLVDPITTDKNDEYIGVTMGMFVYSNDYKNLIKQENVGSEEQVDENGNIVPSRFTAKIFPNPAKEQTTFEISIPEKGLFEISLFDMSGKMIQVIRNGELNKGKFRQELDLIDLVPGMYLIVINSGNFKETVRFSKI